jgi:hypothetical protein
MKRETTPRSGLKGNQDKKEERQITLSLNLKEIIKIG